MPRTTAYSDTSTLLELGVLTRDVVKDTREIDPYFEDIRNARDQLPETEE